MQRCSYVILHETRQTTQHRITTLLQISPGYQSCCFKHLSNCITSQLPANPYYSRGALIVHAFLFDLECAFSSSSCTLWPSQAQGKLAWGLNMKLHLWNEVLQNCKDISLPFSAEWLFIFSCVYSSIYHVFINSLEMTARPIFSCF